LRVLEIFLALTCLLLGGSLLYQGISNPGGGVSFSVIAGSTLFSVGLTIIWFLLKRWLHWRKYFDD
jgi:hypothetical protein